MKNRLVLVINPRSSGYSLVHEKIVRNIQKLNLAENQQITYEIQPTNPLDNAEKMAGILQDNDIILVAGGDGTAHIATNAIIFSDKQGIKIKYTGFGNFNDYAHSFSKNTSKSCLAALESSKVIAKIKPLKVYINGDFYRLAPLYATIGLTAEMAEIFEHPKVRGALKVSPDRNTRLLLSLLAATRFYFNHRKSNSINIKNIELDDDSCSVENSKITDLVFMNGPRMARIMKSNYNKKHPENFGFQALDSSKIIKNIPFLTRGIFGFIPLKRTNLVSIWLKKPQDIFIQIEGESAKIKNASSIRVEQSNQIINIL